MKYNWPFLWALMAHGDTYPETGCADFFDTYSAGGEL